MEKFAERLKELRIEKGLSQKQLSLEFNQEFTQAAISLWEQGKRVPSLDAARTIADFFGVTIDYLAGRED